VRIFAAHILMKTIGTLIASSAIEAALNGKAGTVDVLLMGTIAAFFISLGGEINRRDKRERIKEELPEREDRSAVAAAP
jgi:hypothetical protein